MRKNMSVAVTLGLVLAALCGLSSAQPFDENHIPLPEHPRPDFQRPGWLNLNGPWQFKFDAEDIGLKDRWSIAQVDFPESIMVPFPWGSQLSGVEDKADIGG